MAFFDLDCAGFVELLASKAPVPGGGGAAALVGAVGAALGNMAGGLTLGKKKYAAVEDDILDLKRRCDALQRELLQLIQRDAEVFEPLSKAYGMPKETGEQQNEKARVMAGALAACSEVPLQIMDACCRAIDLQEQFAAKCAAIAISDVGCGVICCKAALQAASLNVFINTKAMENRRKAEEYNQKANDMLNRYLEKADSVFQSVAARFQ